MLQYSTTPRDFEKKNLETIVAQLLVISRRSYKILQK